MLFFKNDTENKTERLVLDLFLFFKKALYEVKRQQLGFNIFPWSLTCHKRKANCVN